MRPTRSYSGQHFVQRVVHLGSLFRVERVHGAHQNFERIARKRFLTFARQSQTDASPGQITEDIPTPEDEGKDPAAVALGRRGGAARAAALGKRKRAEIARKAAAARWKSRRS
jgi:hypothetical protein